eukprot:EG_transcript_16351
MDRNECLNAGCRPVDPIMVDGKKRSCVLHPPGILFRSAKTPMRLAFVGASDSGKSTCLNSLLAYTLGAKPLPEGAGKERQNTQLWRIEPVRESKVLLLDTPGFRFGNRANVVVRDALISGVAHNQDTDVPVKDWVVDPNNAVDRFIHVLNVQHAVQEGTFWNHVIQEVVADWAAAFDVLDDRTNYSPVILINTYGYNTFTVAKVRSRIHQAFGRLQSNAIFEMDCKTAGEHEFAKMFTQILMQDLQ